MTPSGAAAPRTEPDRFFPGIDGLRAAAALLVLVFHVAERAGLNRGDTTSWVADYTSQFGRLGVSIFFAISGFLLYRPFVAAHLADRPGPALGGYFRRRFLRIFPAYWLALVGYLLLASPELRDSIRDHLLLRVSLLQGWSDTLALSGVSVAWTLTIELTFYLVLPLYAWLVRRLARSLGRGQAMTAELLGLGAFYLLGLAGRWLLADKVLPIGGLAPWMDLFAMGMVIAVYRARQREGGGTPAVFKYLGRYPVLGLVLALELVWVVAQLDVPRGFQPKSLGDEYARHFLYGFVGFALLAPLVFGNQAKGAYRRVLCWRPVRWTGEVSYGVYLWHVLVLYLLTEGLRPEQVDFWPVLGATFAITLVIASASFVLLERPMQRLQLHRLVPRSSRAAPPEPGSEPSEPPEPPAPTPPEATTSPSGGPPP
ncbi:MAG: acyltransferase [Acidimicrobiales bacterium]|nr:acyltransferase [Acidimicrobiales bacterium]